MTSLSENKNRITNKTKNNTILFVCIENAGRSQIAEAFFRKYASREYESRSAGTIPTSQINPFAIEVMKEVGIDISNQKPKELTKEMIKHATKIINMGCMDKNFCPAIFSPKIIDWKIEDPKGKSIDKIKEIRDEIEKKVKEVIKEMDEEPQTDEEYF